MTVASACSRFEILCYVTMVINVIMVAATAFLVYDEVRFNLN